MLEMAVFLEPRNIGHTVGYILECILSVKEKFVTEKLTTHRTIEGVYD